MEWLLSLPASPDLVWLLDREGRTALEFAFAQGCFAEAALLAGAYDAPPAPPEPAAGQVSTQAEDRCLEARVP